jgi:FkbM family methyltransferase
MGNYSKFFKYIPVADVDTIFELGSRDGLDAIELQKHFQAQVYAWECNPDSLILCRKNLDSTSIQLVEKAVWSKNQKIKFFPIVNGNIGASSAFQVNTQYPHEELIQKEIEVDAVRIDSWYQDKIDLVAMDLQGSELEALKGMGDLLKTTKYIITEGQFQKIYQDTPHISTIENYLSKYGFDLVHSVATNDWFGDFLFVRYK